MLTDWINEDNLNLIDDIGDWREAVALAVSPMISNGSVEERYLSAIYAMHEEIGPYYVLGEGIAMPHSRPEDGVNKTALSLLIVDKGVNFGSPDNDPVHIIFALSAVDSHSHIDMIASLSSLFCEEEKTQQLRQARSKAEALAVLAQV